MEATLTLTLLCIHAHEVEAGLMKRTAGPRALSDNHSEGSSEGRSQPRGATEDVVGAVAFLFYIRGHVCVQARITRHEIPA